MKTVKQINLLLKNEPGTLSGVSDLLGANGINIIAFYVSTEKDEGKLHFVANDPDKAINVLKTAGYSIEVRDVIACVTPHHPGGLNAVLKPLKAAGVGPVKEALEVMEDNWIRVLDDELYHI
ncbi:MAG: ACT domain-containing protein [Deltaproteobacteria bacterium]|nr:ACT domain-containing protein [Deltaproteobacteria bacterium]